MWLWQPSHTFLKWLGTPKAMVICALNPVSSLLLARPCRPRRSIVDIEAVLRKCLPPSLHLQILLQHFKFIRFSNRSLNTVML